MDGVLLIDKPSGLTSFDVVRRVRKRFRQKKVGHAGTLDPLASGLLIVCLGQGTKLVPYLMDGGKQYEVTITLGIETDTLDSDGDVVAETAVPAIGRRDVERISTRFLGTIAQVPPLYSALKKGGEALYKKARRGETVALQPRAVRIDEIVVRAVDATSLTLTVDCGKGTYIRSLARDLAAALGTVGHVSMLRRTRSGGFAVAAAHPLLRLDDPDWSADEALMPVSDAVPELERYTLSETEAIAVGYGQPIVPRSGELERLPADAAVALMRRDGALLSIARQTPDGRLKTVRGFSPSVKVHRI